MLYERVGETVRGREAVWAAAGRDDDPIFWTPIWVRGLFEEQRSSGVAWTASNNWWHFGMKVHIGVDSQTGNTAKTSANVHDCLLHGGFTKLADAKRIVNGK